MSPREELIENIDFRTVRITRVHSGCQVVYRTITGLYLYS